MTENKHFISEMNPNKSPKRLFRQIIERLKIEKHLKFFKERFWIFFAAFIGSVGLIITAFLLLNSELKESESVLFLSLLFSDTFAIFAYYKYFALAVLESLPIVSIILSLAAISLAMTLLRFAVNYHEKILILAGSIKKLKRQ